MLFKAKFFKLAILIMLICIFPSFSVRANDIDLELENKELIGVRFIAIEYFRNWFDVSDQGIASFTSKLIANNVDRTHIYSSIQKYVDGIWVSVNSWASKVDSSNNELSRTYFVPKGFYYRLKSTAYVYTDEKLIEKTTFISNNINY